MKKNVPLLICLQSKNNLPSLSTAHWGRLVKVSVSEGKESSATEDQTKKKLVKGMRKEGGVKMENGAKVGGQRQGNSKNMKRRKSAGKDLGQMDPRESEKRFMKL